MLSQGGNLPKIISRKILSKNIIASSKQYRDGGSSLAPLISSFKIKTTKQREYYFMNSCFLTNNNYIIQSVLSYTCMYTNKSIIYWRWKCYQNCRVDASKMKKKRREYLIWATECSRLIVSFMCHTDVASRCHVE